MTTPAAQTLTQAGIAFETVRFDPARDAETAAAGTDGQVADLTTAS